MSTKILACLLAAVMVTAGGAYYYVSTSEYANSKATCASCSKPVTATCTEEGSSCCSVGETKACCMKEVTVSTATCCADKMAKVFAEDAAVESPCVAIVGGSAAAISPVKK